MKRFDGAMAETGGAGASDGPMPSFRTGSYARTILSPLWRLALPTMSVNFAQIGVSVAEVYYISFLGTAALAGAALVFPIYMLMQTMSGGGLGNGVSSAIARATGAGRREDVAAIQLHGLVLAVLIGAACSVVMLLAGPALFRALGARGEVLRDALHYSTPLFLGVTCLWVTNALASSFRGMGNPMLPAKISLAGAAFMIPVSPAFIFGFGPLPALGIGGAGLALVLYQCGAMLTLLWCMRKWRAKSGAAGFSFRSAILADIFRIGIPSSFNSLQQSLMAVVMASLATRFGVDALAGYGIAARLDTMLLPPLFGIASAVLTLVGMNVGARNVAHARQFAWAGTGAAMAVAGIPGIVVAIWPDIWAGLFSDQGQVLRNAAIYLHVAGGFYMVFAAGFILCFAVQGAGSAIWASAGVTLRFLVTVSVGWVAVAMMGGGFIWLPIASALGLIAYAGAGGAAVFSPGVWRRGAA
ncbi:hypothetical protein A0J57_18835 [Sphingobium sp. 22B]|uniref:MATE family efflux transporter n=1 Tax=unclassified Sphingobium TaxID=2611147 RepID=UPI0007816758|nr:MULTISPECIES: MATE family efflux transporter [unclassified Sphingobium]KXU30495.1 hypothetical protein AXW74_17440 [Sphingobium sp. AM]KYC30754.1 hypothetical protein A0J57_18835 [Sphingobium sp. 22B]OAP30053.1 hypothetical protein A8O16_20420 [Sphingobium sp. 20006FA]